MAEAGEWTNTKLINLILGIILLVIIIVGSITGQIDPLIDQVGAKFDEWILKAKQTQRDTEIIGNFEVNPDGTCKLLNEGVNNNNYTFDYYTNNFYLNGEQVNNKIIDGDLKSLKEERDLYYAIIKKLEDEEIDEMAGKTTNFAIVNVMDLAGTYFLEKRLYYENGLLYYLDDTNRNILVRDTITEEFETMKGEIGSLTELEYFSFTNKGVLPENIQKITQLNNKKEFKGIYNLKELTEDLLLEFNEKKLTQEEYTLLYNSVESLNSIIVNQKKYSFKMDFSITSVLSIGAYPLIEVEELDSRKEYAVQFTSNFLYFRDLVYEGGYSEEEINDFNFLLLEKESGEFVEYPNKEYILNDDAFNEMLKLNEVYQYMVDNCV